MSRIPAWCCALLIAWTGNSAMAESLVGSPVFVANRGQHAEPVLFEACDGPMTAFFTRDSIALTIHEPLQDVDPRRVDSATRADRLDRARRAEHVVLRFVDAAPDVSVRGERPDPAPRHVFRGERERWVTGIPAYSELRYSGLRAGTDLEVRVRDGHVAFDVVAAPGVAAPGIVLDCAGATAIGIGADGALELSTGLGILRLTAPRAWEEARAGAPHRAIASAWRRLDQTRVALEATRVDPAARVVIDPGIVFSTFVGGSGDDVPTSIEVAPDGRSFVVGYTESADFPWLPGPATLVGGSDVFVRRYSASGALDWSARVGGAGSDWAWKCALTPSGDLVIGGETTSGVGFPSVAGGFDTSFNGGGSDGFLAVIDGTTAAIEATTFLGSAIAADVVNAVTLDAAGAVVAAGMTVGAGFPVTAGAFDLTFNGGPTDVFAARLAPDLSALEFSTYLGGAGEDGVYGIGVVSGAAPVLCGATTSTAFPVTAGALDIAYSGGVDGFVTRLTPSGSGLAWSTFLGATGFDTANDLRVDDEDGVFVVGSTTSTFGFPLTVGAFDLTFNGAQDAFVTRLDAAGALGYSTYLGGSAVDAGIDVTVDRFGRAHVTGCTVSTDFPTTPRAADRTSNGGFDAFVTLLSSTGSILTYSSYLGGALDDVGYGIEIDGGGDCWVTGITDSPGFPVTAGSADPSQNGATDGFVTRFDLPWSDLGSALAGTLGTPELSGDGSLAALAPTTLSLADARPASTAILIVGFAAAGLPFMGGTLVPAPDVVVTGLPVDASGNLVVSAPFPAGIPSGFRMYFQYWIADPVAPRGYSASNGLVAEVP